VSAPPAPPRGRSPLRLLVYSLLPTVVLLATLEGGLRLAGFEFHGIPTHLRFGPNLRSDMERDLLEPDPELFWRVRATPEVRPLLERRRALLPGGDLPPRRAAGGAMTVLVLGDSCSFFGTPSWPERLEALLRERDPGAEVWNAAVPGYSSYQGRRLLETRGAALSPDWVVAYFGWNDHWLGLGSTDRLVGLEHRATLPGPVARFLERLRLVQAGRALRTRLALPPPERRPLRVPPGDYRANLEAICRLAEERGARVAFVTAPEDLDAADGARLREGGYAAPGTDIRALHARYNGIAREVAGACGAHLADFAAAAPGGSVGADGIHLTPAGAAALAALLARELGGG